MSDPTPDPAAQPTPDPANPEPTPDPTPDPANEPDWKAEARKWEDRAKANKKAADDLEKQRKAAMTEAERAVAEAEERGRKAATSDFGSRLAKSEFVAAAARRNPSFDAAAVLEDLNLARFVTDDGEPDAKAIEAAVVRLVPEPSGSPSFDGGARTPPPVQTGMSSLIRKAAGRA